MNESQNPGFKERIRKFRPPLHLSCITAVLFSAASLTMVCTELGQKIPAACVYAIYAGAGVFLALAVWALVLYFRTHTLKAALSTTAHRGDFTARLWDDYAYRTMTFGYGSLGVNGLLAISKAVAGWYFSSVWLSALAGYYLLLCVAKALMLRNGRRITSIPDEKERSVRAWKAFRTCGILLVLLTLTLQGVVILIVREGNTFAYHGLLIYVVATYDFYCLISSIVYMAKTRKKHSPSVVAIKCISFATSLVAILSLQTAMFASFGDQTMEASQQRLMNTLTGSAVCLLLILLGIMMIVQAASRIKEIRR